MRACREHLVLHLQLDLGVLREVAIPAGMLRRAALRRDDHVPVAVVLVDQRRRARLAGLAAFRRQQEDLRAVPPDVSDLAAGLPVAANVLLAEQVCAFAHQFLLISVAVPIMRERRGATSPGVKATSTRTPIR